jgi:hypothetical protein
MDPARSLTFLPVPEYSDLADPGSGTSNQMFCAGFVGRKKRGGGGVDSLVVIKIAFFPFFCPTNKVLFTLVF